MMEEQKQQKRRLNSSYATTVVSITLVLFTTGLFGIILVHAQKLSDHIRENIGFEIIMKEDVREASILELQKSLDATTYVKSTEYITKEEATEMLSRDLGEDFMSFLSEEENPLLPSLDVRFKASWANNDSLAAIEQELLLHPDVKEVYYQKSLVHLINQNVRRIGIILLGFTVLLLIIAVALINNTIRLSIYSKRFLIRSMQLVGATEAFIRRPFIVSGIVQGVIASLLAGILLLGVLYAWQTNLPELRALQDIQLIGLLFGLNIVLGIIFAGISTFMAVGRFLRMQHDRLYE